jgi:hypothetical protein
VTSPAADTVDAAKLVRFALQPRLLPSRDAEYQRLVREWPNRPELQAATEAVADALGVWIVAVDPAAGAVACAENDSPFELRIGDFMRQARAENQWGQRVAFAVTMLAAWRLCFPQPAHLDDPRRVGRVSADELIDFVNGLCDRLDEAADAAGDEVDPPVDEPGLERAWRAWRRRGTTARTPDGRLSSRTTSAIVARTLGWMVDQGLLEKASDDAGGTYRSRPRLRILVREVAASEVYEEVLALAATPAPDRAPAGEPDVEVEVEVEADPELGAEPADGPQ